MRSVGEFLQGTVAVLEQSVDSVSIASFSERNFFFLKFVLHEAGSFSSNISMNKKFLLSVCFNRGNT